MHPLDALAQTLYHNDALPFQRRVFDALHAGRSVVLQAPTGAGKTFAALAPLILGAWGSQNGPCARRLIYSLPLRVLAGSLRDQYAQLFPGRRFTTQYGGSAEDLFLDEGEVVFTTIDQTLSGFIGVPLSAPRRLANVLCGSVLSAALVFDEFHLLEPEKSFDTAVHLLRQSPWPVLVMTATMSNALRMALAQALDAEEIVVGDDDLPRIRSQHETVKHVQVMETSMTGAALADTLGQRTLIVCNRVGRAQKVYEDLCEMLDKRGDSRRRMLLHSRFLPEDRRAKEALLREWFGQKASEPAVLVATQVVEAGLDISCSVMHTEASPMDSFLQRIGRAARFENEREASVYIYPPEGDDASRHLPYNKDLVEATLAQLRRCPDLRYETTQALLDEILTDAQRPLVPTYLARADDLTKRIHSARWNVERSATREIIRHVNNVEVIVAKPQAVEAAGVSPYAWASVGVPVSTMRGYFRDGGRASVVEEFSDDFGETKGAKLYAVSPFDPANPPGAWETLRLVVSPEHAAYDETFGLRLGRSGSHSFTLQPEAAQRLRYDYERETYYDHIRRVLEQAPFRGAACNAIERLSRSPKHPKIKVQSPEFVMDVMIWAHDVAKLTDGWQRAHGDADAGGPEVEPLAHGGRVSKPPPHAAESAWATSTLLAHLLAQAGETAETWKCVLAAIRTHHSPTTLAVSAYRIRPERQRYLLDKTAKLLPQHLAHVSARWGKMRWTADGTETHRREDVTPALDPLFALLVYALRRSDQRATSEVSFTVAPEEKKKPASPILSNCI